MSRGGARRETFPWAQVRRDRRAERVRAFLDADACPPEILALVRHHMTTWGRGGARTSVHTLRSYEKGVRTFLAFIHETYKRRAVNALEVPPPELGVRYLRYLETSGASPATVNQRRASARALYRALRWAEFTTADPFLDAPAVRDPTGRADKREPYTDEDITALRRVATPAEAATVLLGAHAALRVSEAVSLVWRDVDLDARVALIRGKGGKAARVALSGATVDALRALTGAALDERILPYPSASSVRHHLRTLCTRAGVRYRGYHSLRHYAGTRLYRQTQDLHVTAAHLRHTNISTTTVYAHLGVDAVRKQIEDWG